MILHELNIKTIKYIIYLQNILFIKAGQQTTIKNYFRNIIITLVSFMIRY